MTCTHPEKWVCWYGDDRVGCHAQAVYEAVTAPPPPEFPEDDVQRQVALGRGVVIESAVGPRGDDGAVPDSVNPLGVGIYASGFIGTARDDDTADD